MTTPAEAVGRLRAVEAGATPGPWIHLTHDSDSSEGRYTDGDVISPHHDYAGNTVSRRDSVTGPDSMTFADGEFIALARTAFLPLLECAAALEEGLTAWENLAHQAVKMNLHAMKDVKPGTDAAIKCQQSRAALAALARAVEA